MKNFYLLSLYGISLLGLYRRIFHRRCPANGQSVVAAGVKVFHPLSFFFFISVLIFNFKSGILI